MLLTIEKFKSIKADVKQEMTRRGITITNNLETGEIICNTDINNPVAEINKINDHNFTESILPNANNLNAKISDYNITELEKVVLAHKSFNLNQTSTTDCKSSCTGGCYTGCMQGCKSSCTGGCSGCDGCTGCGSGCDGCTGCGSGCSNGCTGSCKGGCNTTCNNTCSTCSNGCAGSCYVGNCTGGCTGGCLGTCVNTASVQNPLN